ncbi:hypothetical protein M3Y95_00047900 [Aphelenchoides besseyi]|nr:hypothetical protein M3Y95_00047900 [Aphelenchoides besseyi]
MNNSQDSANTNFDDLRLETPSPKLFSEMDNRSPTSSPQPSTSNANPSVPTPTAVLTHGCSPDTPITSSSSTTSLYGNSPFSPYDVGSACSVEASTSLNQRSNISNSGKRRDWGQRREEVFREIDFYMESERKTSRVSRKPSKPDELAAEVIGATSAVTMRASGQMAYGTLSSHVTYRSTQNSHDVNRTNEINKKSRSMPEYSNTRTHSYDDCPTANQLKG